MKKIVLASNNKHKIREFKEMFCDYDVLTLDDIGFFDDIEETGTTLLENSLIKARAVTEFLNKNGKSAIVIADDSGLFVDALDGAPGVYSARYSGNHNDKGNRDKLLQELRGEENRTAYYACTIVKMKPDGSFAHSEGKTFGRITDKEYGTSDFGYDRIFFSDDLQKTFGEATDEEKNKVSHRARALEDLKRKWD